ncbi:MAG: TetR/AcrR family transcriptional regulator [Cellulosilyticaceae bacterium]
MPKIIHDLDKRIEEAAMKLFSENDYDTVDMKMIAKHCHIAVGTLYNYCPNKKELFVNVFRKSWEFTAKSLDAIYETSWSPEEKISHSIEVLYDDIASRKGMGRHIYKILANYEMEQKEVDVFHILFFKIERLFDEFEKKSFSFNCEFMNVRLAKSLIVIIQNSLISYPHAREDNLHFIQDFFYNSMHVDMSLKKNYLQTHQ